MPLFSRGPLYGPVQAWTYERKPMKDKGTGAGEIQFGVVTGGDLRQSYTRITLQADEFHSLARLMLQASPKVAAMAFAAALNQFHNPPAEEI